jgi:integrase
MEEIERKPTMEGMELAWPSSLKEIVMDEVAAGGYRDYFQEKEVESFTDEAIEQLMQRIYEHIEKQTLAVHKSNEPWALKQWVYSNILKDVVICEANQSLVEGLISPVVEWQKETFDPLTNFLIKLEMGGRSKGYISVARCVVAPFIAKNGRKKRYTEEEIQEFLYKKVKEILYSSYATQRAIFASFLKSLPDGGQELHIPKPKLGNQPPNVTVLSKEQIDSIIASAFVDKEPPWLLNRLLCATVFGCRVGELEKLSSEHIDLKNRVIVIPTSKGGAVRPQTIPEGLEVFLRNGMEPVNREKLRSALRRICQGAGVDLPKGASFHAIRRGVVTALFEAGIDSFLIYCWMRWAAGRQFGMLPTYVKTKQEEYDKRVIDRHPFVEMWQGLVPLIQYLQYSTITSQG